MCKMIEIRKEKKEDYEKIYNVIKTAFQTAEHCDGNEQDLVNDLRNGDGYIPELSLVALSEGKVVGYIMFTKILINNNEEIALAPLAVLPEYQRQGIGIALIEKGHSIARRMGYHYSVVLGDPNYYKKFGYVEASKYNIKAPFDVPDDNFMAIKLSDDDIKIEGIVEYAKEFGI